MTSKKTAEEPEGTMPCTWKVLPLEALAHIQYGLRGALDRGIKEGIPVISLPNVSKKCRLNLEGHAMAHPYKVADKHILKRGDIIFNWRNGSLQHLGKTAYFNEVGRYTHVHFFLRIRVNHSVNGEYLFQYLRYLKEIGYFMNARNHINNTFNKQELAETPTVLPSKKEQQFIALALREWDGAIDRLEKGFKNVLLLKKKMLTNIFSGRKRGASFRGQDWWLVRFSDFVKRIKDKCQPGQSAPDLPCIELEHVESGHGRLLGSVSIKELSSTKYIYKVGDVLFGRLRPYLRKFYLPEEDGLCSTEYWVLRPDSDLCNTVYLYYLIQSPPFMQYANHLDGSGLPRSNWDYIADFQFPLPTMAEQRFIAQCLTQMDRQIELRRQYLEKVYVQASMVRFNMVSGKKRMTIQ